MRVGILTAARTNNNGTDLQAVAMQRVFATTGADVEIINYKCEKLENSRKILPSLSIKNLLKVPLRIHNNIVHNKFRKKYFKISHKIYDKSNIDRVDYDRVVVGSDQIWNLNITGNDLNFFLPFNLQGKKYSYAASLGKTDINNWQEEYDLSSFIACFDGVSVREESGIKALEKIGISSRWDLDPLLMASRESWNEHINYRKKTKKYVLVYLVERNIAAVNFAKKYAKKAGAEVLMISDGIKGYKGVKSLRFCSVDKWLWLMKNADFVVTNSYHGLSMAIAFGTEFSLFPLLQNAQSNSRMLNLVERLDLGAAVATSPDHEPFAPDWKSVEGKLSELRKHSINYIKSICS